MMKNFLLTLCLLFGAAQAADLCIATPENAGKNLNNKYGVSCDGDEVVFKTKASFFSTKKATTYLYTEMYDKRKAIEHIEFFGGYHTLFIMNETAGITSDSDLCIARYSMEGSRYKYAVECFGNEFSHYKAREGVVTQTDITPIDVLTGNAGALKAQILSELTTKLMSKMDQLGFRLVENFTTTNRYGLDNPVYLFELIN